VTDNDNDDNNVMIVGSLKKFLVCVKKLGGKGAMTTGITTLVRMTLTQITP
jgi:hypothetical protein